MLNPTAQHTTVSTVASGAHVMEIDADGMGTVLSILSNMYSNGPLAVAREYISNGIDSHVEAGNSDPVLVTSPSHFNPTLTVQDFGVGLSHDEVLNVYAKYGTSTKRGCRSKIIRCSDGSCDDCKRANAQIGAFGIGAKSAFTVGTQFVVTAVKDGELTVALFALDANGAPTVNIVKREFTNEPNGVKVEVGVKDVQGVQDALDKLTSTLPRGSVVVDGVAPVSVWDSAKALADDVHVTWREDRYNSEDPAWVVVMGGVPYSLPDAAINTLDHRQRTIVRGVQGTDAKVILSVPIGAVDITPSREDLRVTDKTTATLAAMVEKFNSLLPGWVAEQVDEAPTLVGAMIIRRKLQSRIGAFAREHLDNATWHGKRMGIAKVTLDYSHEQIRLRSKRGSYYGEKVARREKGLELLPNSEVERMLFVVNTPPRRIRSVQLAAKPYLQDQSRETGVNLIVAVTAPYFAQEWFDTRDQAITAVEYDDFVKEWKPAVSPAARSNTGAQYRIDSGDKYADTMTVEELNDLGEAILYLTVDEQCSIDRRNPFLAQVVRVNTVIFLKATQKEEVLLKKVPLAEKAWPHIQKAATDTFKSFSQTDLDTIAAQTWMQSVDESMLAYLENHRNGISNPVVLKVLDEHKKLSALHNSNSARVALLRQAAAFLGTNFDSDNARKVSLSDYRKVANGLPLMSVYLEYRWKQSTLGNTHLVQYINSITL